MTKTILIMGQSNAIGRDDAPITTSSAVTVWNNQNDISTLANVGSAYVAPNLSNAPFVNGKANFGVAAMSYMAEMSNGEPHRMILVAKGATPIDQWMSGSGTPGAMYSRMQAVLTAAGVGKVDAFFWHQGEDDESNTSTYQGKWNNLVARMQSDGVIDASTPIVIGETSYAFSPNINSVLNVIASASARVEIAKVGQFRVRAADNSHFEGAQMAPIGLEYAYSISKLAGPWRGTWRAPDIDNYDAPMVSSADGEWRKIKSRDLVPSYDFVYATGQAVTLPSGVDCVVPVRSKYGNSGLISPGGAFVASREGLWRFDLKVHGDGGKLRAKLLNGNTAKELEFVAYSGGLDSSDNNPIISGFAFLRLFSGENVALGVNQGSGSTKAISYELAEQYFAFAATFMGPY